MFDRTLLPNPSVYYGQLFPLKGNKKQQEVLCCFHHEKTASLSINLQDGSFNCFSGCGASGGNVLDFHIRKNGLNFVEAVKDLGAWVDTKHDTPEQLAARKKKVEQADRDYKTRQEQAAKAEKAHAHKLPSTMVPHRSRSNTACCTASRPPTIRSITSTPRVEPMRQGVHLPQDSSAQNSIA